MSLGKNIAYLRKRIALTQDELAEKMSVSRQTVSKWETDEAFPEINKLTKLADLFHCKVDTLLREDLEARRNIYSEVSIKTVAGFRMARYVMITPNPEDDVNAYISRWTEQSGLKDFCHGNVTMIGWDFPFVSAEQQNRFGLRGYAAAAVLPEGFDAKLPGVEIAEQPDANYAVITITDPFAAAFERIPAAYQQIMNDLEANGFKEDSRTDCISCFEHVYEKDGTTFMDVHILADGVAKSNVLTPLQYLT